MATLFILNGVLPPTLTAALAATETADTVAIDVTLVLPTLTAALAASEGADTATVAVTLVLPTLTAALAASEGADIAAVAVQIGSAIGVMLAATEGADTAAMTATVTASLPTTWNPTDKSANIALSNSNRTATKDAAATVGLVRAATGKSAGKFYFEITQSAAGNFSWSALCEATFPMTSQPGADTAGTGDGFGVQVQASTTLVWRNGSQVGSYGAGGGGLTVGIHVDFGNALYWISRGGTLLFGNPSAGTGGLTLVKSMPLFIAFSPYQNQSCVLNTGQAAFVGTPASGFGNWT